MSADEMKSAEEKLQGKVPRNGIIGQSKFFSGDHEKNSLIGLPMPLIPPVIVITGGKYYR